MEYTIEAWTMPSGLTYYYVLGPNVNGHLAILEVFLRRADAERYVERVSA